MTYGDRRRTWRINWVAKESIERMPWKLTHIKNTSLRKRGMSRIQKQIVQKRECLWLSLVLPLSPSPSLSLRLYIATPHPTHLLLFTFFVSMHCSFNDHSWLFSLSFHFNERLRVISLYYSSKCGNISHLTIYLSRNVWCLFQVGIVGLLLFYGSQNLFFPYCYDQSAMS